MRYLNGESSIKLGEELKEQKLIITLNNKYYNGVIYRWNNKFKKKGINGLKEELIGRPPKIRKEKEGKKSS